MPADRSLMRRLSGIVVQRSSSFEPFRCRLHWDHENGARQIIVRHDIHAVAIFKMHDLQDLLWESYLAIR